MLEGPAHMYTYVCSVSGGGGVEKHRWGRAYVFLGLIPRTVPCQPAGLYAFGFGLHHPLAHRLERCGPPPTPRPSPVGPDAIARAETQVPPRRVYPPSHGTAVVRCVPSPPCGVEGGPFRPPRAGGGGEGSVGGVGVRDIFG